METSCIRAFPLQEYLVHPPPPPVMDYNGRMAMLSKIGSR
jgi:hypothetical protein